MKQLLKVKVGSHAFGTNIETSDEDFLEVHQCSNEETLGFNYKDELQFTKDHKSFELKKFLWLLIKANPNCLEMLFSDESKTDCHLPYVGEFFLISTATSKMLPLITLINLP